MGISLTLICLMHEENGVRTKDSLQGAIDDVM